MPAKPVDLSAVTLRANDHVDDSFSLAMVAAAQALGVDSGLDYEAVYCVSANAFAPMVDTGEDCTSHWACEAWLADRAMPQVAAALGLQAARLELPEVDPKGDQASQLEAWKRIAAVVRQALDGGAVVLTTGGWDIGLKQIDGKWQMVGPHGFVFWGAAGIVTQADPETGAVVGLHPNGHRDNPIVWPANMWALTVAPGGPAKPEATLRETLRLAVERIRASGRFQGEGKAIYGTDAMRVWADQMAATPGFCAGCWAGGKGRSWTDAYDNGMRLYQAAQIAARYLRSRQDVSSEVRKELAAAASGYDKVAAALAPSVGKDSPEHYRNWIGDLEKQCAHAEVLRQIDGDLLMAANHLEQAARAMEKPAVPLP